MPKRGLKNTINYNELTYETVNSTSKCKFRELFHKSIVWVN